MLKTNEFGKELKSLGFDFFSGVPCSFLSSLINYAINECDYITAVNEGNAVSISSGAVLAGKKSVVLMQNSGLTNALSPLTSLNYPFQIPILGFVSLRGEIGLNDEPQHELMGQITTQLLDLIKIKWEFLSDNLLEAKEQLLRANNYIENEKQTFFFVVRKNTFDKVGLKKSASLNENLPKRIEALEIINKSTDSNTIILATTGKTGRELCEIEDKINNFYMVGSMGCISSLGLGLALNTNKKVIIIDGDGSLLMHLGSIALNSYYKANNICHILLDNGIYDSTGGQETISKNVDFMNLFNAVKYRKIINCYNLEQFSESLGLWLADKNRELAFLYLKIKGGSKDKLGRPKIKPVEMKNRLMEFINNG